MLPLKVRNVAFGQGIPKICVPMVGSDSALLREEAAMISAIDCDLAEWRVDYFEDVEDIEKVKITLREIHAILMEKPILFTFRSVREGGQKEIDSASYFELNKAIIATGEIDLVDVELFNDEKVVREIVKEAHANDVKVVISSHDFHKTPPKEEILKRLRRMQELGADMPKVAVMPQTAADVLVLLDATNTMKETYADRPFITMSMAGMGIISRLTGEIFGSALTFGAAKKASAPGQLNVADLRNILNLLHERI